MRTNGGLLPRSAAIQLRESVADFRVVVVNGPRQAGKTTLLEMFRREYGGAYRSLDEDEQLTSAIADPSTYVQIGARPLIIDEVQRGGDALVLAVKREVDRNRDTGQFILSGSTRFLTVPTLSESLAGRAAFVDLWPFSVSERATGNGSFIDHAFDEPGALLGAVSPWARDAYLSLISEGSFPEVVGASSAATRRRWFNSYIRTVVARDISEFADVQHAQALPRLLGLIAARSGGTFVLSDIGQALAVNHETARIYTSYLETVFLVTLVPAWSTNVTTRITKTPKAFLTDSGMSAHLLRAAPEALRNPGHPDLGGLVETFVFTELLKLRALTGDAFDIYHYRDRDGREVDFICEAPGGQVIAIEVKATASPKARDAGHLGWLRDKLGERFSCGIVLHLGANALSYGDRLLSLPVSSLWGHAELAAGVFRPAGGDNQRPTVP